MLPKCSWGPTKGKEQFRFATTRNPWSRWCWIFFS